MFDAGFSELILIFVLGLLILGPERLPRVAAQLGRWVSRARRTAMQLRMQLEREIELNDVMRPAAPRTPPSNPATTGEGQSSQEPATSSPTPDVSGTPAAVARETNPEQQSAEAAAQPSNTSSGSRTAKAEADSEESSACS